ncbi:MAG TPA: HU family DNA-binding protein [Flavipsychrobacter sp.]
MDVAKYIGLFLLKNEQCYVHGLGTLQLSRKPATYDGINLQGPSHEIIMVPGGNVDESLANYIATNEQISITKASNALRDFSSETKNNLDAGNMVTLPHLGKFSSADGRISFITDPHLQYKAPSIKAQRGVSMQQNERPPIPHQPYIPTTPVGSPMAEQMQAQSPASPHMQQYMHPQEEPERLNWARIIFVLLLLIVMAGGAYYAYERFLAPKPRAVKPALTLPEAAEEETISEPEQQTLLPTDTVINATVGDEAVETMAPATATQPQTPATTVVNPARAEQPKNNNPEPTPTQAKMITSNMVIATTDSKAEAYKKKKALNASGYNVDVREIDTNLFDVVLKVKTSHGDIIRIEDSLTKLFGREVFGY